MIGSGQKIHSSSVERLFVASSQDGLSHGNIAVRDKPNSQMLNSQPPSNELNLDEVLSNAVKLQLPLGGGSTSSHPNFTHFPSGTEEEYDVSHIGARPNLRGKETLMMQVHTSVDHQHCDRFQDVRGESLHQIPPVHGVNLSSQQMVGTSILERKNRKEFVGNSQATSKSLDRPHMDKLPSRPAQKSFVEGSPSHRRTHGDEGWSRHNTLNAFSDLNPINKEPVARRRTSGIPASLQPLDEIVSRQNLWTDRQSSSQSGITGHNQRQNRLVRSTGRQSIDILTESELGTQRKEHIRDVKQARSEMHSRSTVQESNGNSTGESKKQGSKADGHQSHWNKNQGPKGPKKQRSREYGRKNELKGG